MTRDPVADELGQVGEFRASDGYPLKLRRWTVSDEVRKGYILALHGIQSHSGWYAWSCGRLAQAGFEVIFPDRRGSGMNQRERGHATHEERLISDAIQILNEIDFERNRAARKVPLILLAVSWGAKLAAIVAARRPGPIDGLALLYPGICAWVRPNVLQRALVKFAAAGGRSRRLVSIPLDDPQLFTSDPHWQQFIRDDPLALHRATAGLLAASMRLDRLAGKAASSIACPTLMMLAGRDDVIDNAASQRYFERLSAPRGKLIEYHNARHTLEFEACRNEFVDDLIHWLQQAAIGPAFAIEA